MNFPPISGDLHAWARAVQQRMAEGLPKLLHKRTGASAADDGLLLWDREGGTPVVTLAGAFRKMPVIVPAPATATDPGQPGMLASDGSYLYVCTAANTWRRVAIAVW